MAGPTNQRTHEPTKRRTYEATITPYKGVDGATQVQGLAMAPAPNGCDMWLRVDTCPATGARPTDNRIEHTTSSGKCRFLFAELNEGGEVHLYCSHDTHSINFWAVVCDGATMAIQYKDHPAAEDLHRVSAAYAAWLPQASQCSVSITDPLLSQQPVASPWLPFWQRGCCSCCCVQNSESALPDVGLT
jgi:hypothetical protein